jgi:hypothetical protein
MDIRCPSTYTKNFFRVLLHLAKILYIGIYTCVFVFVCVCVCVFFG